MPRRPSTWAVAPMLPWGGNCRVEASLALLSLPLLATAIQGRRHSPPLLLLLPMVPLRHMAPRLLPPVSSRPSLTGCLLRLVSQVSPKACQACRSDRDSQYLSRSLLRLVSVP